MNILECTDNLIHEASEKDKQLNSTSANVGAEIGRGVGYAAGAAAKGIGKGVAYGAKRARGAFNSLRSNNT